MREALTKQAAIPARVEIVRSAQLTLLHLSDVATGALLALMDVEGLFALRASLLAALAIDALSLPEAKRVAVLGGGLPASSALKAVRLVRSLREVWLVTPRLEDTIVEAAQLQQLLKTPVRAIEHATEAVANADLILLTGGVALPEVALWPSVHLSVPSARRFPTAPVTPGVLAKSWRVGDAPGVQWGQPIQAELGGVLAGTTPRPEGVHALFIGSEPASLDLLAAWHVYLGAQGDEGLPRVDFEP